MLTFKEEEGTNTGDWVGVVSDVDEPEEAAVDGGVLIVPAGAEQQQEEPAVDESAMDLSIPHTESIPSDLGELRSFHELRSFFSEGGQSSDGDQVRERATSRLLLRTKALWIGLAIMIVGSSVVSNVYLVRDRNSWRTKHSRLLEQVEQLQSKLQQAEEKVQSDTGRFSWEEEDGTCGGGKGNKESAVLIDNCWFQAELGNCALTRADETKKTIQKNVKKIKKGVSKGWKKANQRFWSEVGNMEHNLREYSSSLFENTAAATEDSSNASASKGSRFTSTVLSTVTAVAVGAGAAFLSKSLTEIFEDDTDSSTRNTSFF